MQFRLNHKQVISVTPLIHFQHYSKDGECYGLSLNQNQFKNLDDLLSGYNSLTPLEYYPLGEGLWIRRKKSYISITDNYTPNIFTFNPTSLQNYRTFIHSQIKNIFLHGSSHHCQSYANHESSERSQRLASHYRERKWKRKGRRDHTYRGCISHISESEQAVYGTSRNVTNENEKQTKYSNISRRHRANPRPSYRRRGGRDEARIRHEIEEGEVDAKLESDTDNDKELGDESANIEGNSSPQYQLE